MNTDDFLERVRQNMESYFAEDRNRIDHAMRVADHAAELLRYIDADSVITMAAAYLHDIGIPEAERKHGSCAGRLQEVEGPPVARAILENIGVSVDVVDTVCTLVSRHHTPGGVDSPEFRILWDSDALVNLAGSLPGKKSPSEIRETLDRCMVTEPGFRRALALFGGAPDPGP